MCSATVSLSWSVFGMSGFSGHHSKDVGFDSGKHRVLSSKNAISSKIAQKGDGRGCLEKLDHRNHTDEEMSHMSDGLQQSPGNDA